MTESKAKFLEKWDHFAAPMPPGNIEGSEKVGSLVGFSLTLLMVVGILSYSVARFLIFARADRP